jgi:hypothetical protein
MTPMNAANQVVQDFDPAASEFVLTDDQGASYTIQSLTWDNTSGTGTMTFTAPTVSVGSQRTLSMTMDGNPLSLLPNPLTVEIMPPFGGKSVMTDAWLAWDLQVPNSTMLQMGDYSGNNNYAVAYNAGYFLPAVLTATSQIGLSATTWTTLGRTCFSVVFGTNYGANAPVLNAISLATATFTTGIPFGTISTVLYTAHITANSDEPFPIWNFSFVDANGKTRQIILYAQTIGFSDTDSSLRLDTSYNGTSYQNVIYANVGSVFMKSGQIGLITLVFNADGSGTLYLNSQVLATVANVWGSGAPVPPMTGPCTLTAFGGLSASFGGDTIVGDPELFGQLELVAYTSRLTAAQVQVNAAAWGLTY